MGKPTDPQALSNHPTYDEAGNRERIAALAARGVDVWGPERVYIAADVPLGNIEPGSSLINATLSGPETRVGRGSRIGVSGLARIENCQIGRDVELGAGSYQNATLLDSVRVRGFAEIREGTLLEEQVDVAHSVAFKNTVLTATVVTGSLINYCDLFMSGGTSRKDHSEVGSGAVHFNFDPRGDKWSSMIGDATGVLLESAPIFVGGNSGLVGPVAIGFGAVIAAGAIVRRNVGPNCIHVEAMRSQLAQPFDPERYTMLGGKFTQTARLVGSLHALDSWYEQVRLAFAADYQKPLYYAARRQIERHIVERAIRLQRIIGKLDRSIRKWEQAAGGRGEACIREHRALIENQEQIVKTLVEPGPPLPAPQQAVEDYQKWDAKAGHVSRVGNLDESAGGAFADWLRRITNRTAEKMGALLAT